MIFVLMVTMNILGSIDIKWWHYFSMFTKSVDNMIWRNSDDQMILNF